MIFTFFAEKATKVRWTTPELGLRCGNAQIPHETCGFSEPHTARFQLATARFRGFLIQFIGAKTAHRTNLYGFSPQTARICQTDWLILLIKCATVLPVLVFLASNNWWNVIEPVFLSWNKMAIFSTFWSKIWRNRPKNLTRPANSLKGTGFLKFQIDFFVRSTNTDPCENNCWDPPILPKLKFRH